MITNFEEHTQKITKKEIALSEIVLNVLKKATPEKPMFSGQLLAEVHFNSTLDINITSARLRTIIHYLRVEKKQPIVGTSKGYFLTSDLDTLKKQKRSMMDRVMAILQVAQVFDDIANEIEFDFFTNQE